MVLKARFSKLTAKNQEKMNSQSGEFRLRQRVTAEIWSAGKKDLTGS